MTEKQKTRPVRRAFAGPVGRPLTNIGAVWPTNNPDVDILKLDFMPAVDPKTGKYVVLLCKPKAASPEIVTEDGEVLCGTCGGSHIINHATHGPKPCPACGKRGSANK